MALALALGCSSAAPATMPRAPVAAPSPAPFFVPAEESLAYYATMRWGSESPTSMTLLLERDLAGRPRLVAQGPAALDHRPYPMTDEDAVAFVFPQPPRRRASIRRILPIRRLSDVEADPQWREHVAWASGSAERALRRLELEREAELSEGQVAQRGWALFDTERGRYRELHYTLALTIEGHPTPMEATVDLSLSPERSARRSQALAQIRHAYERGQAELPAYVAEHDARDELATLRAALLEGEGQVSEPMLWFHARANPGALWRLLVAGDGTPPDVLIWVLVIAPVLEGEELPDSVVTLLLDHLQERSDLRLLATRLTDLRFRPLVERWAAGEDDADPELQQAAGWALQEWERDAAATPDAIREAVDDPEAGFELLSRYLGTHDDPRPVVPVLIDWLATLPPRSWEWHEVQALLQRLAQADFQGNLAAWRAFYDAHADRPYRQWLMEGARRAQSRLRLAAYQELAAGPADERARRELRRGLEDAHPLVRMVAAEGLAHWGDPSGAPRLIELLDASDAWIREAAFMALASLHPSTLGYDPQATELERARAIGRWRAWSEHATGRSTAAEPWGRRGARGR